MLKYKDPNELYVLDKGQFRLATKDEIKKNPIVVDLVWDAYRNGTEDVETLYNPELF